MNKKKILYILMIILGMSLISYPIISNYINMYRQTTIISNYQQEISKIPEEERKKELEKARMYNEKLEPTTAIDLSFNNSEANNDIKYTNVLNIGETMGFISIPKIDIYLPIYHGISEDVLQSGVGHIEKSSLPIGGENTHAALAGHSGLARTKIFDDLDKLNIGDIFYIYVLNETLQYQIDKIDIVLPNDTETIKVEKDKDYVTLVTCTPRVLNTHRLLVRGTRIQGNISDTEKIEEENQINYKLEKIQNKSKNKIYISIVILLILFFLLVWMFLIEEKKGNK